MLKNRTSPKRPLIAALIAACLSMLFAAGYRGKYKPAVSAAPFEEFVLIFVIVFIAAFVVFYVLRLLGVHISFGGREEEPIQPAQPTRGKAPRS